MARKCCVRSCKADVREARAKGLPLHKFPKDAALRDRWLASGGFDAGFRPTPGQVVCHRHFKRADYETARGGHKLLLKRGSVPTVFAGYDDHPGTWVRSGTGPDGTGRHGTSVRPVPRERSARRARKTQRSLRLAHPSLSRALALPPLSLRRILLSCFSLSLSFSAPSPPGRVFDAYRSASSERNVSRRAGVMPNAGSSMSPLFLAATRWRSRWCHRCSPALTNLARERDRAIRVVRTSVDDNSPSRYS